MKSTRTLLLQQVHPQPLVTPLVIHGMQIRVSMWFTRTTMVISTNFGLMDKIRLCNLKVRHNETIASFIIIIKMRQHLVSDCKRKCISLYYLAYNYILANIATHIESKDKCVINPMTFLISNRNQIVISYRRSNRNS